MGASIYIADDEKNIRDLITKFLESDGYSVTAFETGDELMEEFLKKPCELVILDIMMPGTDGLTICRRLRTITDVPIIMLTAKDSEYDYVRGITLGGDDYLTKPFRLTTLLMRVKSLLRRMDMNTKKVTGQELSAVDGVEQCCCIFDEKKSRLKGFFVGSIEKDELAASMSRDLPAFMVPGVIRRVDEMPLTKNGKIDRKKLAEIAGGRRK